jgi:hypothetical protein
MTIPQQPLQTVPVQMHQADDRIVLAALCLARAADISVTVSGEKDHSWRLPGFALERQACEVWLVSSVAQASTESIRQAGWGCHRR